MIPENTLTEEAKNELNKINEIEKTLDRLNLVDKTHQYNYSLYRLKNFQTINIFSRDIYIGKINLKEAEKDQSSLLVEFMKPRVK